MMLALHEVLHRHRHIVTQIVETELIVRTESHVAFVSLPARVAVRFVFVNAVHRQSVEHIERSHPLGVSFGKIVIDSDHVYTLACERIQEYRERSNESLALTCSHLGNLALMQDDTADDLHIIVHHIPGDLISAGDPVVLPQCLVTLDLYEIPGRAEITVEIICSNLHDRILREPAGCGLHDSECLRKNLVQHFLDLLIFLLHELVGLGSKFLLLAYRDVTLQMLLDFGNTLFKRLLALPDLLLQFLSSRSELVIRKFVNVFIRSQNLLEDRLHLLHIAFGLGTEHFLDNVN